MRTSYRTSKNWQSLKKLFHIEIGVLKEQLYEMEIKSVRLENKIGFFKAKEQEFSQQLSEKMTAKGENQE